MESHITSRESTGVLMEIDFIPCLNYLTYRVLKMEELAKDN